MTEPAPNFDRIARPYATLERLTLGRSLERCRTHFLPELSGCRSALVLGDGDGRFIARLLAANLDLHADAVDLSPAMLTLLRRNCAAASPTAAGRLKTHHADALSFTPASEHDLIVTHFFLDCLTQPQLHTLVARLTAQTAASTTNAPLWLISDFRIPAGPMHCPGRLLVRSLYLAFRLLTGLRTTSLPDHAAALLTHGWQPLASHRSLGGLLTSELWQLSPEPPTIL